MTKDKQYVNLDSFVISLTNTELPCLIVEVSKAVLMAVFTSRN